MNRRQTARIVLGAAAIALGGCTGVMNDPRAEVAQLELKVDHLGALLAVDCVAAHGEHGCSRYPNPGECDVLTVSVRADGRTCGTCRTGGEVIDSGCGGVADGIPILCHATPDLACQQCVDIYGNTIFDSCNRGAQLFRAPGGGWDVSPGAGWLEEPGSSSDAPPSSPPAGEQPQPPPSSPPAGAGETSCDPNQARLLYAGQLNKILASEGLALSYAPDLSKTYDTSSGYWGYGGHGNKGDMCTYWLDNSTHMTKCWTNQDGRCHCKPHGSAGNTCKCARINVFALRAACQQIPPECDDTAWVAGLVMEYGVATQWLFNGSYGGSSGYYGGLPSNPGFKGEAPRCLGSPLVVDLEGDGVEPTSPRAGVRFDLLGLGPVRTAWVAGDDALLALDRNGNGRIDDGSELFGEGTDLGGAPAADGFAALAQLDLPQQGGNGNGRVDGGDLMFDALRVWTDDNRDGISQPGELRGLTGVGITSLGTAGAESCGTITDAHGNDLSLRGRFTRADGRRGLVVDVLFASGR